MTIIMHITAKYAHKRALMKIVHSAEIVKKYNSGELKITPEGFLYSIISDIPP